MERNIVRYWRVKTCKNRIREIEFIYNTTINVRDNLIINQRRKLNQNPPNFQINLNFTTYFHHCKTAAPLTPVRNTLKPAKTYSRHKKWNRNESNVNCSDRVRATADRWRFRRLPGFNLVVAQHHQASNKSYNRNNYTPTATGSYIKRK